MTLRPTFRLSSSAIAVLLTLFVPGTALAQGAQCGGNFSEFLLGVKAEAVAAGVPEEVASQALAGLTPNPTVLSRDRSQSVFRQTFLEFSQRTVSASRLKIGAQKMNEYADAFARAEREFGVPAPVITAFWALETDFGAVQGDFNTLRSLATLAHDCRRPELFRPELLAALQMAAHGDFDPNTTTGAWAGEIGQVQMLPVDIVRYGTDGDGDGHVRLKDSSEDAILTAAKFIRSLGWRPGEPWIKEVILPGGQFPYEKSGFDQGMSVGAWIDLGVTIRDGSALPASMPADLVLPQGRNGPAFLTLPNFSIYLEWNRSFIYTTSAAYFATRLAGAEPYRAGNPGPGLDDPSMKHLQQKLRALGHDVGEIDGILGAGTRTATRAEQLRLGMPADGWPTPELLRQL